VAKGSGNNVGEAVHYTLHLTNNCNMECKYCYVDDNNIQVMSFDTAKKAVDLASKNSKDSIGIIFFGGEPLLHRDLIYETVEYCKWKDKQSQGMFHFKITTNGMLLDEEFMNFSAKENIFIALSHDGIKEAHDSYRIDRNNIGTFDTLSDKLNMLISRRPYAPVLMVVNPDTAEFLARSVEYLYSKGFRYIISSLNYAANWTDRDMEVLKSQYEMLGQFYFEKTIAEDKFYLSPFEVKISSHISGDSYCHERCELGKKQISVAPDGLLYPCVQFVGEKDFSIGNVNTGIDRERQETIYSSNEEEKVSCQTCSIRKRCNHYCGCMNKQSTGSINKVSPIQCSHERLLLPIADRLAEKLYKKKSAMFIQKHYNDMFPMLSLIEDSGKRKL
jgi:uncharacterized protein